MYVRVYNYMCMHVYIYIHDFADADDAFVCCAINFADADDAFVYPF